MGSTFLFYEYPPHNSFIAAHIQTHTGDHPIIHPPSSQDQPSARGHPQIPHFITRPAIPDWSKSMQDNSRRPRPSVTPFLLPPPRHPSIHSPPLPIYRHSSCHLPSFLHASGLFSTPLPSPPCIITLISRRACNAAACLL